MLSEQLQLQYYDDGKGDAFEYGRHNKISSIESNNQRAENQNVAIDEIDSAKFALFCKWLNESNFEKNCPNVKCDISSHSNENESSDDEFVDTNNEPTDKQFKETLPLVIEQANISATVHETNEVKEAIHTEIVESSQTLMPMENVEPNQIPELEKPTSIDQEHIYETLLKMPSQTNLLELPNPSLLSLNLSCASSASDLTSENGNSRRPASHNKGRAPPVPSPNAQQISEKMSETAPQDKDKKKKNLLTYLPSIFKPITPSNSFKNLTKETDI